MLTHTPPIFLPRKSNGQRVWRATVHWATKSRTWLSDWMHTHAHTPLWKPDFLRRKYLESRSFCPEPVAHTENTVLQLRLVLPFSFPSLWWCYSLVIQLRSSVMFAFHWSSPHTLVGFNYLFLGYMKHYHDSGWYKRHKSVSPLILRTCPHYLIISTLLLNFCLLQVASLIHSWFILIFFAEMNRYINFFL